MEINNKWLLGWETNLEQNDWNILTDYSNLFTSKQEAINKGRELINHYKSTNGDVHIKDNAWTYFNGWNYTEEQLYGCVSFLVGQVKQGNSLSSLYPSEDNKVDFEEHIQYMLSNWMDSFPSTDYPDELLDKVYGEVLNGLNKERKGYFPLYSVINIESVPLVPHKENIEHVQ